MKRCLEIAQSGLPAAMPNPAVGAVLVYNDKIIGEGFTSAYGGLHAEVNAFATVKDKTLLADATLYVSLEPCSHFGKTPPCCDLIIKNRVKKVVVGMIDPFAEVSGKGIQRLREAGIEVQVGVLENDCWEANKRFFTFHQKKRPYIILKWAQTLNGFIAPLTKKEQAPVWLTTPFTRQWVHKLRSEEQAILVGTNTVLADNPKLNTRDYFGASPVRVILDQQLKISNQYQVLDNQVKTIILNAQVSKQEKNTCWEQIDFNAPIANQITNVLYQHNIQSVIIEGGTQTLQTFIASNLWDEAYVCIGKTFLPNGIAAPTLSETLYKHQQLKSDQIITFKNTK
ncbi:bifunctional diaminohydroxyphosphoribosylaminopyrimidine deaminase/5-amino-6-(5-phosphoribosylamino)uracil reductase RibD [Flavobacterium agricola]|uniref:Riboflavin biosynthesis protein RibD n=1 Tax=Flavobacterium agricola TaxID=2870839 RepID=A0ABY6LZ22_9FLAO|nr:bifunctional diaminohydroxyphosphoribosylaminopyrimidine deaminase/5-amino-6-(5-phosphoribosylamino)uracil reductase RibD [Flavobacterium agricola]UYW01441.1 bifunctional diaminohydroxyphosphoribosylaminopyrimidine deaminase/5-amino-6-(5-phosphoribosylamino)uracil reductase RibD [Flavobacterium agricola]